MTLGQNIERLRKERNWTREDLAAALEESTQTVARWETGKNLPAVDRLIHMSMLFEVSLQELAGEQAALCDLQPSEHPAREAEKKRKDRLLLFVKCLLTGAVIGLGILINMVWLRFVGRFAG